MKIKFFIISLLFSLFANSNEIKKILVFGGETGWFGQKVVKIINEKGHVAICAKSRLENRQDIINEIDQIKPDFIINAAGITGNPNVDWCENHKQETLRVNILGTLNLIDIAFLKNLHVTNLTTGCIYEYDKKHPMNSGIGFTENDEPNFDVAFYHKTKVMMEKLVINYPNVLNLRIKMPISSDLNPKSFITKILNHKKIINIPNSMAILDDLLPVAVEMTLKEYKGTYNFVNPGYMSHNEVLDLYKKYVDPDFNYTNFTEDELKEIFKNRRSNAVLDSDKLLKEFNIPNIKDSIIKVLCKIKEVKNSNKSLESK